MIEVRIRYPREPLGSLSHCLFLVWWRIVVGRSRHAPSGYSAVLAGLTLRQVKVHTVRRLQAVSVAVAMFGRFWPKADRRYHARGLDQRHFKTYARSAGNA